MLADELSPIDSRWVVDRRRPVSLKVGLCYGKSICKRLKNSARTANLRESGKCWRIDHSSNKWIFFIYSIFKQIILTSFFLLKLLLFHVIILLWKRIVPYQIITGENIIDNSTVFNSSLYTACPRTLENRRCTTGRASTFTLSLLSAAIEINMLLWKRQKFRAMV